MGLAVNGQDLLSRQADVFSVGRSVSTLDTTLFGLPPHERSCPSQRQLPMVDAAILTKKANRVDQEWLLLHRAGAEASLTGASLSIGRDSQDHFVLLTMC